MQKYVLCIPIGPWQDVSKKHVEIAWKLRKQQLSIQEPLKTRLEAKINLKNVREN